MKRTMLQKIFALFLKVYKEDSVIITLFYRKGFAGSVIENFKVH